MLEERAPMLAAVRPQTSPPQAQTPAESRPMSALRASPPRRQTPVDLRPAVALRPYRQRGRTLAATRRSLAPRRPILRLTPTAVGATWQNATSHRGHF